MTRLIQISDLHLLANAGDRLGLAGVDTTATLAEVLAHVQRQRPDVLVMSGDLSQDGSVSSYKRLAAMLQEMGCPVYWVLGNHDDCDNAKLGLRAANLFTSGSVILNGWQMILLDSTAPGLDDGFIGTVDFAHLEHCLRQHPSLPTLIVMHHHAVPVGCYMDAIGVLNAEQFLARLRHFPQVRLVLFGHVHQEFAAVCDGIHFLGAPATCVQFAPRVSEFAIDTTHTPGYRWLELQPEGGFVTGINRISI